VYLANQGQDSVFYRNDLGNKSNWLEVELTGTHCNRNAIGTRVTVVSEGQAQIREVNGGNGDHSQCPYRQHFGLGQRTKIDYVELRWPTGYIERFENVKPNQIVKYVEQTPQKVLDERKIIKEGEIAALQAERRKEKERAEAAAKTAEPEEIDWNELGAFKKDYLRYKQAIQEKPNDPKLHHEFGMLLDKQGRKTAALTELERAIELEPEAMPYSNAYRTLIRGYGHVYYDRSIRFFEDLAAAHPKAIMPRLNQSLAYVDKMPYPKLGIVSQGQLSNKSLAVLDSILLDDSTCWTAKFIRGMNHLHWPRKLGHAPMAIKDFTELIEMQKKLPPEKQRQYFAFGYIGLGDSYAKNRDEGFEENLRKARETWERGLREYPNSPDLKQRLELFGQSADQHELIEFIDRLRGLEDPVDTDLSRVWVE
jgi:tetratricopeptide (TPR) repeat protein